MTKSETPAYRSWGNMLQRCTNPNNPAYPDYGGRGISVCVRWESFDAFLTDMGDRPLGMTLERIDNDGDYHPGNCRWATRAEQNANRRGARLLSHGGETLRISEWARRLGVRETRIRERLNKGWTVSQAVSTPPSRRNSVARKRQVT